MRPVGYLINKPEGPEGTPGSFYTYWLAGNGVFVNANSPYLKARVRIAGTLVRGLKPLETRLELKKGPIPRRLWDFALSVFMADITREKYLVVVWEDGAYRIRQPAQEGGAARVEYERVPNAVLDIHSHGTMGAFFSPTDDRDEQAFRLYMVAGRLDRLIPETKIRAGVYGYFAPVRFNEIFS